MNEMLEQFHFIRPWWLLLTVPAALLLWRLSNRRSPAGNWERVIAPDLLAHLLERPDSHRRRGGLWLLGLSWLVAIAALAGPTWEKLPQPVLQQRDALVVVVDLSLSMFAEDVDPTRIQRVRYKLQDLLQRRREGLTGLVVYSADAHVVTPLTDDTQTIAHLLPALTPELMPQYGSNPVAGIGAAISLLQGAEATAGRILLITDGITENDQRQLAAALAESPWGLSILAVGTAEGAPVRLGETLLRDASGQIVVPRLEPKPLQALVGAVNGRYSELSLDDRDLQRVLPPVRAGSDDLRETTEQFDQWRERGPLMVLLLLPLAALGARRGWVLLMPLVMLPLSPPAQAIEWRDLWQRPNQQGAQAFANGDMSEAARQFEDPAWRGTAHYRAEDYQAAAEAFAELDTAEAHYNRGNALTQAGQYRQALMAYEAALQRNPEHADAAANRRIAQELLRRQVNPDPPDAGSEDDQNQNDQSGEPQDGGPPSSGDESASRQTGAGDQKQPADRQPPEPGPANSGEDSQPSDQGQPGNEPPPAAGEKPTDASPADAGTRDGDPILDGPAGVDPPPGGQLGNKTPEPPQTAGEKPLVAGAPSEGEEAPAGEQAVEQWLRRIPDDPAGLLRRKFRYESRQRALRGEPPAGGSDGEQPLW